MNTKHLSGRRILVTGGTGFVGRHLLPVLIEAGAHVSVLCRQSSKTSHLPRGVQVLRADLGNGFGVADAVHECDILIHMAAMLFGLSWQDYFSANFGAAKVLATALHNCGRTGPERVIMVSSLSAAGPCSSVTGRDEKATGLPVSAYGWSKLLAENVLSTALGDRLVILRPPIIYGSGDLGLLPVYKGLQKGVAALPGIARPFPVSAIHVDDVVRALVLACLPQACGLYHLSDGHIYSMAEFYQAAAEALGVRACMIPVPLFLMGLSAAVSTLCAKFSRKSHKHPPSWTLDKFREARQAGWTASSSRIRKELGFSSVISLKSGMNETILGNHRLGLL